MSYEAVNIYLTDQNSVPISSAVVRFFDATGAAMVTQGFTDVDGLVSVLLPSGILEIRCYKFAVDFGTPVDITILEGQNNTFDLNGEVITGPVTLDSRLCMSYGYFRKESGAPAANVDIHFIAKFDPLLLDGSAVMPSRVATRTNDNGYAQMPLIRNGMYDVMVQGDRDMLRLITVPDQANVNLPDLLFPVVQRVEFSVDTPWSIAIGASLEVTPTVYLSDGNVLTGTALSDVNWSVTDDTIVGLVKDSVLLTFQGLAAGIVELEVERADYTIIRIPDSPIVGQPVTITVA